MTDDLTIKFDSKALNRSEEQVFSNAATYIRKNYSPRAGDLHNDQQLDLNDSNFADNTPGLVEYIRAFQMYFPQVRGLWRYESAGFKDAVEWGWLEVFTQLLPAIHKGVRIGKVDLSDNEMIQFGKLIYDKGVEVATGTLKLVDEKDEKK